MFPHRSLYIEIQSEAPLKQLKLILDFQLKYYERKGKEIVSDILENEFVPYGGDSLVEQLLPTRKFVSEIIRRGQKEGLFSSVNPPEKDTFLIMSLIMTYSYMWIRDRSDVPLKEMTEVHIEMIIDQVILNHDKQDIK